MITRTSHRSRIVRRAFTLVEMLVAIGIIVILAVLTVGAAVGLIERSEIRETENTMQILDLAVAEWEAQSDRRIRWGKSTDPVGYDMYDGAPHILTTSELLFRIARSDAVKPILAQIKPDRLVRFNTSQDPPGWLRLRQQGDPDILHFGAAMTAFTNGELNGRDMNKMSVVLDAWGTPIRAVHPGRTKDPILFVEDRLDPTAVDEDGTIPVFLTYGEGTYGTEEFYGTARDRRILFVSAGPDGQFGNLAVDHDEQMHQWAEDNVVSYRVEDDHE